MKHLAFLLAAASACVSQAHADSLHITRVEYAEPLDLPESSAQVDTQDAAVIVDRAIDAAPSGYIPSSSACPDPPPTIRSGSTIGPDEKAWLPKRRKETIPYMRRLLKRLAITGFDSEKYFSNVTHNSTKLPNIAIAISGGGYRAMVGGAGVIAAWDARSAGSEERGNLGGLLQSATYISGLSGGDWLVGSLAPEVSFVHDYPGPVKTGIFRGSTGMTFWLVRAILRVIGPLIYIPSEESGERHLFLATSMAFPAATQKDITRAISGVPLVDGIRLARGIDGREGSGVYSIDQSCESAKQAVVEVLTRMGAEGVQDRVWGHTEEVFKRIIGEDGA